MNRLLSILNEIGVASALRHEAHKLLQLINLRYSRASKRSVLSRVGGLLMLLSFGVSCAVEEHEDPIVIDEETMPVSVVDITPYGATLRGSFGNSYVNAHEVGIKLSLQNTQYIGTTGDEYLAEGIGGGEYELTITNLYADTTYYFKTFQKTDVVKKKDRNTFMSRSPAFLINDLQFRIIIFRFSPIQDMDL